MGEEHSLIIDEEKEIIERKEKELSGLQPQDQISNIIFQQDDVTWQTLIYELARTGKINAWDIDISQLTKEYLKLIKNLKEHNFRLSGKVVLAAAILLKLKTERLGLEQLLALTNPEEYGEPEEDLVDAYEEPREKHFTKAELAPRIPGVRKRQITVFELVDALKQALEVDERRSQRLRDLQVSLPDRIANVKKIDIFAKINLVWKKLQTFFFKQKKNVVEFTDIIPSKEKKDVIWTFLPLLHLANHGKINLRQDVPLGPIYVDLLEEELRQKLNMGEVAEEKEEKKHGKG